MVATCDLAAQVRGKAMRLDDLDRRAAFGVGWTPTNSQITAHGAIAPSPWGARGDTYLRPDLTTLVEPVLSDRDGEARFVLADIMTLEGEPWACCPRGFLKRQIDRLAAAGFGLKAAFEHEFAYLAVEERVNSAYALDSFRRQGPMAGRLIAAMQDADILPDTIMPEYGPCQYEVTVGPKPPLRAADEAVIVRELVRTIAFDLGERASFTPLLRPDAVGNGVHVHFSLTDRGGRPCNHAPDAPFGISAPAASFLEGVRRHLPAMLPLTAAGTVSYLRLRPNRWSAVSNNVGLQDREASLRVCPVFDRQRSDQAFHFEYRAGDATACPYLALGAIIAAGIDGIGQGWQLSHVDGDGDGEPAHGERLPQTLDEALVRFADSPMLRAALGETLHALYLDHKRFEADRMSALSAVEQCERYLEAY